MNASVDPSQEQDRAPPKDSAELAAAESHDRVGADGTELPPTKAPSIAELEQLAKEKQELRDQLQRSRAELVNYRRRTEEERWSFERKLTGDILRRVLPLFDDLSLALSSSTDLHGDSSAPASSLLNLRRGLTMIGDKLDGLLRELGVEPVPAHGQHFDPELHEALLQVESAELPAGSVVAELRRGYRIGNHLIRPARVSVAKPPPTECSCDDTCQ